MKYYLGVDIGGMSIKIGAVNENGEILSKNTCPTNAYRPYTEIVKSIYELCLNVVERAGLKKEDISGVGIGSPGTVNGKKGIITYSGNLHFVNAPIVKEFRKNWDIPTFINNDANCAALGETCFGSGKKKQNTIMITLGTGIGTGFIVDGKIFEGTDGEGAEGGHICIRVNGEKCTCGERGCWEAYASATGLINLTKKALEKHPESSMHKFVKEMGRVSGRTAFLAYNEGDKAGTAVVKSYVRYVATGLTILVNIFRPDIIIIGGGVSNEGEYFVKMVERYVRRHAYGGKLNKVGKIVKASLGNDAGIVGAAALAID